MPIGAGEDSAAAPSEEGAPVSIASGAGVADTGAAVVVFSSVGAGVVTRDVVVAAVGAGVATVGDGVATVGAGVATVGAGVATVGAGVGGRTGAGVATIDSTGSPSMPSQSNLS